MAHLEQALADFGRELGLTALASSERGEVQLRLASGALLGVAQQEDHIVVHWAQPVRYDVASLLLRAMKRAADVRGGDLAVQVGLRSVPSGEWLVVATRFAAEEVSVRRIHQASDFLRQWVADLPGHG